MRELEIRKRVLGSAHLDVAACYINLALVWHKEGLYDKALENFNRGLEIQIKLSELPETRIELTFNYIGDSYRMRRQYDSAIEFYTKSLEIQLKKPLDEHNFIYLTYHYLGDVYYDKDGI